VCARERQGKGEEWTQMRPCSLRYVDVVGAGMEWNYITLYYYLNFTLPCSKKRRSGRRRAESGNKGARKQKAVIAKIIMFQVTSTGISFLFPPVFRLSCALVMVSFSSLFFCLQKIQVACKRMSDGRIGDANEVILFGEGGH
jgi:hypothetical protein